MLAADRSSQPSHFWLATFWGDGVPHHVTVCRTVQTSHMVGWQGQVLARCKRPVSHVGWDISAHMRTFGITVFFNRNVLRLPPQSNTEQWKALDRRFGMLHTVSNGSAGIDGQ